MLIRKKDKTMTKTTIHHDASNFINYIGYFGEKRLEERGTKIMGKMFEKGTVILNQLSDDPSEFQGSSRFFRNNSITKEALIKASSDRCRQAVRGKHVLAIADTSEIDYQSHQGKLSREDRELGPVSNNHIGFFLQPVLVLDRDTAFPLGISDVEIWNRDWKQTNKTNRHYKSLRIEEKESYRWIECSERSKKVLSEASSKTIVIDREGDVYEILVTIPSDQTDLLIRSSQDRNLYDQEESLFEYLSSKKLEGTYSLEIKNSRKKPSERTAKIEVRSDRVRIARPSSSTKKDYPEFVELFAIEARESIDTVPEGEDGVLWRLLTTHHISNFKDALEIIRWYSLRWRIEEFFRTLKNEGLNVEASQLETGMGLKKLVLMALNVVLSIMQLVADRDDKIGESASITFSAQEIDCLKEIGVKYEGKTELSRNPYQRGSLAWAAWIIGRIGGWKGYRKAGPAGPITMRKGLERFSSLFEGWCLLKTRLALST